MKQIFLYTMAILIPAAMLFWLFFSTGKSLLQVFRDWRLGKELDQLKADAESRRRDRERLNTERLDTGCAHNFNVHGHGMPMNACSKCGMEREKPTGPCDHHWIAKPGPVPTSDCDKCGKTYSPAGERESFA